jgi:hypothetical protein
MLMRYIKIISRLIVTAAFTMGGVTNARADYEPNDNYSSFVLSFQSSKFEDPVCIGTECHEGVSGPAVIFARQIIPNIALGVSGSYLQSSGSNSSITSSQASAFVQGIVGLGSRVDVGASIAPLKARLELCQTTPTLCISESDTGTDVGIFGKVFLTDSKALSLALAYNTVSFRNAANDQTAVELSLVSILAKHHRLALAVNRVRDASGDPVSGGYSLGYSYIVYY